MSKNKIKVKAVIFDMDGIITNTMPDHFRVWKKIFAECGIHVNRLQVYSREGQRGINSVKEIFAEYGKSIDSQKVHQVLKKKEQMFKKVMRKRFIEPSGQFNIKAPRAHPEERSDEGYFKILQPFGLQDEQSG